jgi:hypothetical protein
MVNEDIEHHILYRNIVPVLTFSVGYIFVMKLCSVLVYIDAIT